MNPRNPFASRADGNAKEMDAALLAHGLSVQKLDQVGRGCPDRIVGGTHAGTGERMNVLMEYKMDRDYPTTKRGKPYIERVRGKLNPDQVAWHAAWKGQPVVIARSPAEALAAFGLE